MQSKQSSLFSFEPVPANDAEPGQTAELHDTDVVLQAVMPTKSENISESEKPQAFAPVKSIRGRKKLSEVGITADLLNVPDDEVLFQKKYYSIGLVAEMFRVNISLIRFWENEFDILKPKKNGKGDRHFRPEDIINLKLIHHLLREKKYTIEGARDFLKKNKKADEAFSAIEELKKMKLFLTELKVNL